MAVGVIWGSPRSERVGDTEGYRILFLYPLSYERFEGYAFAGLYALVLGVKEFMNSFCSYSGILSLISIDFSPSGKLLW